MTKFREAAHPDIVTTSVNGKGLKATEISSARCTILAYRPDRRNRHICIVREPISVVRVVVMLFTPVSFRSLELLYGKRSYPKSCLRIPSSLMKASRAGLTSGPPFFSPNNPSPPYPAGWDNPCQPYFTRFCRVVGFAHAQHVPFTGQCNDVLKWLTEALKQCWRDFG